MMPTYAIRIERHSDSPRWYVFTIDRDGCQHTFGSDLEEHVARALHVDLSKLVPHTVARLVGDLDPSKQRLRSL